MQAINKFIFLCSLAVFFLHAPLCNSIVTPDSKNVAHKKMVDNVIRKYLYEYKGSLLAKDKIITQKLDAVMYDLEHTYRQFVQNVSILYDIDNKAVNNCIQQQIKIFGPQRLSTDKCHSLITKNAHIIDCRFGDVVNFGNFSKAVQAHCKNLYDSNTKEATVEKCVKEAGPPFIKQQKATLQDMQKDGAQLVQQAKGCSDYVKMWYRRLGKYLYQKCSNVH